VDVWIVLWVDVFEFWMERRIAGAGKTGIAIIDLDEGIAVMEVGVVVVSGQPTGCGVGDLVGLGRECFVLDEAAEGFGVSEMFGQAWRRADAGAQFLLVVAAGEVVYLA